MQVLANIYSAMMMVPGQNDSAIQQQSSIPPDKRAATLKKNSTGHSPLAALFILLVCPLISMRTHQKGPE